jgi:hypothetical protein
MEKPITYGGLDVHKDTIAVALAEAGKWGEAREQGNVAVAKATNATDAGRRRGYPLLFTTKPEDSSANVYLAFWVYDRLPR